MKHTDKIRLFNQNENTYLYPDLTGHFYVHHVGSMIVWDNVEIWKAPYLFSFVPAVIQHCFGNLDKFGKDIYTGKLTIMEISNILLQHTVWDAALKY